MLQRRFKAVLVLVTIRHWMSKVKRVERNGEKWREMEVKKGRGDFNSALCSLAAWRIE